MGVGREKKLSCFVIRRDLSGFRKLWHPVGGRMQGAGAGRFCNLSLSQCYFSGWLGVRGGAVILLCWSLAQWGWRPDRNLTLDREPMLGWWRHSVEGFGRGKRKALLLIFGSPVKGGDTGLSS